MAKRTRIWVWFGLAVLALLSFAGCSGDDRPDDEEAEAFRLNGTTPLWTGAP